MGDLRDWSPELNGAVLEERPLSSLSSVSLNQTEIGAECWLIAEEATQGIIAKVQPTVVSEQRRKAVIDYVQRLIRKSLGCEDLGCEDLRCEVFPFGSVPLKTYLPDGDIDLTAFGGLNVEEALANDVCSVLEREEQNRAAEFVVKDTQLIRAEVKLVKCLVQNIVVDISFNQLGGLCTLCFLEQVDFLIGKDHLFKRSIILIKAWCYYESRILGAHHGLISTYALETLVLYIFHLFYSSLNGPLAVLYKFLDYFSKFDWDNYCISLNGPVRVSSLPEVIVETPENGGQDVLFPTALLKGCVEQFSVPSRGFETNSRTFPPKHLNILDPLKENNNLGRSVSKGNFFRIRSAFTYGARKLGHILSQPEEILADELQKFFSNTLDRHGSGQRPDVQDPVPLTGHNGFGVTSTISGAESCEENGICESESAITENCKLDHEAQLCGGVSNMKISETELSDCITMNGSVDGTAVSESRLSGDAKDLATCRIQDLKISNGSSKSSSPSVEENTSLVGKVHYAPHLYFTSSSTGNGEMRNGNVECKQLANFGSAEKNRSSKILSAPCKETSLIVPDSQCEGVMHDVPSPAGSKHYPSIMSTVAWSSEDYNYGYSGYQASPTTSGSPKALNLSDLTGDYDSHLFSLRLGRQLCEQSWNASYSSMPSQLRSQFQNNNSLNVMQQSLSFGRNVIPHANGFVTGPIFYSISPQILPGASFGVEEMSKPRGTGTYLPNMSLYRDRPLTMRGRSQAPVRSPRSNGRVMVPHETSFPERSSREFAPVQFNVHQGGGKTGLVDICHPGSPEKKAQPNSNGSSHLSERTVGGQRSVGPIPLESSRQPNKASVVGQNSSSSLLSPKTETGNDQDRSAVESSYQYQVEDFPPLSNLMAVGRNVV